MERGREPSFWVLISNFYFGPRYYFCVQEERHEKRDE